MLLTEIFSCYKGSRDKQRTYMRSMLNDLTLCPKDPKFPGPDKYFPRNFLIRYRINEFFNVCTIISHFLSCFYREKPCNPAKMNKSHIFHPGSYIPESDRFYSQIPLLPGPARYNPHMIACPCKRGTEYSEKLATAVEYQKWRYSPLHVKSHRMKHCTCDPPNVRNIPGKGFTSIFKSATKRLIGRPTSAEKESIKKDPRNSEKFPMILDSQYVRLILQPKRQLLSFRIRTDKKPQEIPDVKFNTTAKTMPRQKNRTNKAVAFMSSCPRFEGDGGKATFLANQNTNKKSKSNISLTKVNVVSFYSKEGTERLTKLPPRYELMKAENSGNDKLGNLFQNLPKPKILLKQVKFDLH